MLPDSWQVLTIAYFLKGIWFIVTGAAYVSTKLSLQFLALSFYQELALNLSLCFVISRGDVASFNSYPSFDVQGLSSIATFMLCVSKNTLDTLTLYEFGLLYLAPTLVVALFAFTRLLTITNVMVSLGVGITNGWLKAWFYQNVIRRFFLGSKYFDTN